MKPRSEAALREEDLASDPLVQFEHWLVAATAGAGVREAVPMALATATPDGTPSVRMVLLRGFDRRGFTFYTDARSRKGAELIANPRAALAIYWERPGWQVRAEGRVERLTREETEAYFRARPLGSRLAASISEQSRPIADRDELERRFAHARGVAERDEGAVELPGYWSGFRVVPDVVEFMQLRPDRLHDRLRFRSTGDGWEIERLQP